MKKSIFDIHYEYLQAVEEFEQYCLEHETDEVPDFLAERLTINQNELAEKIDAYVHIIMEMQGQVDVLDNEIQRLERRKTAINNSIKGLKNLIAFAIKNYGNTTKTGTKNFKTDTISVSFINSFPVEVRDVALLPDKFTRVKFKEFSLTRETYNQLFEALKATGILNMCTIEIEPKKAEIKTALKNYEPIPGAELDRESGYIRIT